MKLRHHNSPPDDSLGESLLAPGHEQGEKEIANWVNCEAKMLDGRSARTDIEFLDSVLTPEKSPPLADGIHREANSFGHSIFITEDGKKIYELGFQDPMSIYRQEGNLESSGETRLTSYVRNRDNYTHQALSTGRRTYLAGLRITATPAGTITGSRDYRVQEGKNSWGHEEPLSKEDLLAGSQEILGAIKTAIDDLERLV
jgi:hypothetical protein